jgi:hypothetical protein
MIQDIVQVCSNIFIGADSRDWNKIRASFADEVLLDYSSLNGQPASVTKADDIINAWSAFFPKFKFTLHFISNFSVTTDRNKATCSCYGHAMHHLPGTAGGDLWEVFGTYEFGLEQQGDKWKVILMRYHHKHATGNLELPLIASRQ